MPDGSLTKTEALSLLHAYELAVVEFNRASVPLIVALAARNLPTTAEVAREELARDALIVARRNVWATY